MKYTLNLKLDKYYDIPEVVLPDTVTGPVDLTVSVPEDPQTKVGSIQYVHRVYAAQIETKLDPVVKDPRVRSIVLENPDKWKLERISWGSPEFSEHFKYDYATLAGKLVISTQVLDGMFEATRTFTTYRFAGSGMVALFLAYMEVGTDEQKKIFSDWMIANLRYTKQYLYKLASMHPWLCENGLVKPSNYDEILESVEPHERACLIAYAQKKGLLEKIEKMKDAKSRRAMTVEDARLLWTVSDKGSHYDLIWKSGPKTKEKSCIIPDKLGSKPVGNVFINNYSGDEGIETLVIPNGVRLNYNKPLHPLIYRNYSNILYPMDWENAGSPEVLEIPEDKTAIYRYAFCNNGKIRKIVGLDHVEIIEQNAFSGTKLDYENLEIPKSVRMLEDSAFADCGVKAFKLNDELETVRGSAFRGCERIFCSPTMVAKIATK
jgi:hypothetical protein